MFRKFWFAVTLTRSATRFGSGGGLSVCRRYRSVAEQIASQGEMRDEGVRHGLDYSRRWWRRSRGCDDSCCSRYVARLPTKVAYIICCILPLSSISSSYYCTWICRPTHFRSCVMPAVDDHSLPQLHRHNSPISAFVFLFHTRNVQTGWYSPKPHS